MSAHHARVEVVLPCLNEARALPRVLGSLPADMRALVVDNGSEDGSPEVARALGARVVGESQRGYGAACHRGLREAEAPLVAFCDADGTIDLGVLTQMADLVQAGWADLVMGRRVAPPGTWPWHARVANAALSLPMSLAARSRLHGLGPVRLAPRERLLDLGLRDRRSGYPLETVLRAAAAGWTVREIDVDYFPRIGRSKVTGTVRGTATAINDMSGLLWRSRLGRRAL